MRELLLWVIKWFCIIIAAIYGALALGLFAFNHIYVSEDTGEDSVMAKSEGKIRLLSLEAGHH